MASERRDTHRLAVAWRATLTRLNGEQLPGCTDNISASGINILLDKGLVLGEPVKIELIAKGQRGVCYFLLEGAVVYNECLEHGLGTSVGLRLLQESVEFSSLLDELTRTQEQLIAG